MFGVGTDYCLLLVSRYREELRRYEDKHEAMAHALRRVGPGDPGQRADGHAGDARAAGRRDGLDPLARPGRGDRRGLRAARRPDAAAGAADDRRPARLLAAAAHGRVRPRTQAAIAAPGRLAAVRRPRAAAARARRSAATVALFVVGGARPARLQGGLQRSRASSRSRPRASTASRCSSSAFPAGHAVADDGARRARRRAGARRPTSPRRSSALARRAGRRRGRRRAASARRDGQIARLSTSIFADDPYDSTRARRRCPSCATRVDGPRRRARRRCVGGGTRDPVRLRPGDRARPAS